MKYDTTKVLNTPFSLIFRLLIDRRSLEACIMAALGIFLLDFIFHNYLYTAYQSYLTNTLGIESSEFNKLDLSYVPIVWGVLLSFIIGTLVIVITFAAQNIPKLIDLYMEELWSLFFIWFIIGGGIHVLILKLLHEVGVHRNSSVLLNIHMLGLIGIVTFPYTFHVLASTKTHRVIEQIIRNSQKLIRGIANQRALDKPRRTARTQYHLFEMLNQLDDLLVYVPFKEPKADIIQGVGYMMEYYIERKPQFSKSFFQISEGIREDISFKTLESQLQDIELKRNFYEQKGLRLIGNAYHVFLETDQFDLSTLCSAQLGVIGMAAIKNNDQAMIDLIMVRFNTHFRYALKHGQRYNEPRNLYNLVFHYGLFANALVKASSTKNVKQCFFYFRFYSIECFKNALTSPPLAFILDTIAAEMSKIMQTVYEKGWDLEDQEALLDDFLLLDNPAGVDRREVAEFFISKNSVRVLQIGLGLFYLEQNEDAFAAKVVNDTLQDLELMDDQHFVKVMEGVFNRLRFSGPTFWEDTDRGNLNIYYTPHTNQLEKFQNLQNEALSKQNQPSS